jgi:hypothetical protein
MSEMYGFSPVAATSHPEKESRFFADKNAGCLVVAGQSPAQSEG